MDGLLSISQPILNLESLSVIGTILFIAIKRSQTGRSNKTPMLPLLLR